MDDRKARLVYTVIALAGVALLAWIFDAPVTPGRSRGLWIQALALTLVAGLLIEPFFSGRAAAMANSVAAVVLALDAGFPRALRPWWMALVVTALLAFFLLASERVGTPADKEVSDSRRHRLAAARRAGVALGSWRFLLTTTLILTLATFNSPFTAPWGITAGALVFAYGVLALKPHELLLGFLGKPALAPKDFAADRVFGPFELVVVGSATKNLTVGSALAIDGPGGSVEGVVTARAYASGRRGLRVYVPELADVLSGGDMRRLSFRPLDEGAETGSMAATLAELQEPDNFIVGSLTEGSTMLESEVELLPDVDVAIGQLLWTKRDHPASVLAGIKRDPHAKQLGWRSA